MQINIRQRQNPMKHYWGEKSNGMMLEKITFKSSCWRRSSFRGRQNRPHVSCHIQQMRGTHLVFGTFGIWSVRIQHHTWMKMIGITLEIVEISHRDWEVLKLWFPAAALCGVPLQFIPHAASFSPPETANLTRLFRAQRIFTVLNSLFFLHGFLPSSVWAEAAGTRWRSSVNSLFCVWLQSWKLGKGCYQPVGKGFLRRLHISRILLKCSVPEHDRVLCLHWQVEDSKCV